MFSLYDGLSFQVHGGGGHGHEEGVAAMLNNVLVFLDELAGHSAAEVFGLLMPGIARMPNIHPMAVHFPIALLVMFFLVELAAVMLRQARWFSVASALLYLGTLCAAVAVYLGFQAAETVAHDEAAHVIMDRHEAFGISILSVAVVMSLWRWLFKVHKTFIAQVLFLFGAAVLAVLIALGADLGGLMVYGHGVGVNLTPSVLAQPHEHSHTHGEASHHH